MKQGMKRRQFLGMAPCLIVGGNVVNSMTSMLPEYPNTKKFWEEPGEEEKKRIEESTMAKYVEEFLEDNSCAESIFASALKYLGQPENMVHAADGFGGGLNHYDLCGLLTGGIMAIGVAAGMEDSDNEEKKKNWKITYKEYWDWWDKRAPLHCHELRPKITGYEDKRFNRMCKRVAAKVEELINPANKNKEVEE